MLRQGTQLTTTAYIMYSQIKYVYEVVKTAYDARGPPDARPAVQLVSVLHNPIASQ